MVDFAYPPKLPMAMHPNAAFRQAALDSLALSGLRRDPRGLRAAADALRSLSKGNCPQEECKAELARLFALDLSPAVDRHLRSAFKDMGFPAGRGSPSASDFADRLQSAALFRHCHAPAAFAIESLRDDAERAAGEPLSAWGIRLGRVPEPEPDSLFWESGPATTPISALLRASCRLAERPLGHHGAGWSIQRQRALPAHALDLLSAWQSPAAADLEMAMAAAKSASLAASRQRELNGPEDPEDAFAGSLAAMAGQATLRLALMGADSSWLLSEHGIGWDGESSWTFAPGESVTPPCQEFRSAFERAALDALASEPKGAPRRAKSL